MNEDCVVEVTAPTVAVADRDLSAATLPQAVRLLVLDTHRLFRGCLAAALRDDGGFAGVAVADAERSALAGLAASGPVGVLVLGSGDAARLPGLLREAPAVLPRGKILV